MIRVLIAGAGFAGMNAAKVLGRLEGVEVTIVDRRNHHVFQPLLYQVAMAGLSPADIAAPIRSMVSRFQNTRVLLGEVLAVDPARKTARCDFGELAFDYLILSCGATHSYFGHEDWAPSAPGLKSLEDATEIRRRVLTAFERAERESDPGERSKLLTFVVVGGGPTGVELAGAIGEMSRHTLVRDFRSIDARAARVILIEAGPRILSMFSEAQATRAVSDLKSLGVEVRTTQRVTNIDENGVQIGSELLPAATVLWAAGVTASPLGRMTGTTVDAQGRVPVESDLSVSGKPWLFVAGDMARVVAPDGKLLPGTAPVAMQQGRFVAETIRRDLQGQPRLPFRFADKGQMATIGRSRAIADLGRIKVAGFPAWVLWLGLHIFYLTGFQNRLLVVLQWAWSYVTFGRGARLIVGNPTRDAALHRTPEK